MERRKSKLDMVSLTLARNISCSSRGNFHEFSFIMAEIIFNFIFLALLLRHQIDASEITSWRSLKLKIRCRAQQSIRASNAHPCLFIELGCVIF